jgi:hypothetical protein
MVWLDGDKAYWRQIELWVCEFEGWEDVHKPTHDALTEFDKKVEIKSTDISIGLVKIWKKQVENSDYIAIVTRDSEYMCRYILFSSHLLNKIEHSLDIVLTNEVKYLRTYEYDDIYKYISITEYKYPDEYEVLRDEFVSKL